MRVYKILTQEDWDSIGHDGEFHGADIDRKDGYIHLSNREQVAETLRLHFKGRTALLLVEFEESTLENLRYELSRNGELFPHLYHSLNMSHRTNLWTLANDDTGVPLLPW